MIHSSKVSFGMLCLKQESTTLPVVAAAAELGLIGEFEGEPMIDVIFTAGLVGVALGKHSRLSKAEPVECQPANTLAVAETASH